MWWIIGILAALLVLVVLVLVAGRKRPRPIVSVVMLRREPRKLREDEARGAVRRALGRDDFKLLNIPGNAQFPMQGYPVLFDDVPTFVIVDAARPYCDDLEATARNFEDPRAREAFLAHRAWVSVDIMGGEPPADVRDTLYAMLGRIAAELLDPGCTLLYAPARERIALPDSQTESALRSGNPWSIFGDDDLNAPIVNVKEGDARVARAIEKARREWPAFVEVWGREGRACEGLVKAGFKTSAGGDEFMWVVVHHLDDAAATGELINEPADVPSVRKGQQVRIRVQDIVDWACLNRGKPLGGFVERVIRGG